MSFQTEVIIIFILIVSAACLLLTGPRSTQLSASTTQSQYLSMRQALIDKNTKLSETYRPYSQGILKGQESKFTEPSDLERQLNAKWTQYVGNYRVQAQKKDFFPPAKYFPAVKAQIEQDQLFHILRKMPKGGSLHLHSGSQGDVWWIIRNGIFITETEIGKGDNGALCVVKNDGSLKFIKRENLANEQKNGWTSVTAKMAEMGKEQFEEFLYTQLCPPGAQGAQMTSTDVWKLFQNVFVKLGVTSYAPFYYQYILNSFLILVQDNCWLQEIRVLMGGDNFGAVSDFAGNTWAGTNIPALYKMALVEFQKQYPAFRLNIISSSIRNFDTPDAERDIRVALEARQKWPQLVYGFDLVNEEDPNYPTMHYQKIWDQLQSLKKEYGVDHIDFFFHDGESDWISNTNIFDCVLLDCKRIGHGLNTLFFPLAEQKIKEKGICLEVCPISNQVLRYVTDLRVHPGNQYFHGGVPMVICSDDPGVFGITGLSYDFWEAVMAWNLNLMDVKRLVYNSVVYSNLSQDEQMRMVNKIDKDWNQWVQNTLANI